MENVALKGTYTYHAMLAFTMSHEFIHLLTECLLSACCMRGAGDRAVGGRASKLPACMRPVFWWGEATERKKKRTENVVC